RRAAGHGLTPAGAARPAAPIALFVGAPGPSRVDGAAGLGVVHHVAFEGVVAVRDIAFAGGARRGADARIALQVGIAGVLRFRVLAGGHVRSSLPPEPAPPA